jgi:mannosyltransferase OCH1-like enzyme
MNKIPKNLFQTWETKNISDKFKDLSQTWIKNNPDYSYFLFDDVDCEDFIKKNFDIFNHLTSYLLFFKIKD